MNRHLVVMAKAPEPGRVKTRLAPVIGADAAAALAARMLYHTLETARLAAVGALELCIAPDNRHPLPRAAACRYGACLSEQGDGDLGRRMARIARRAFAAGSWPIIVGTDCPSLTPLHLRQAAHALRTHDAAFQPVADGGYVVIALRRFHPRLFAAMPWSTTAVMDTTRARLRELEWSWWEGEMLRDIDTPDDLACLPEDWRCYSAMNLSATPL